MGAPTAASKLGRSYSSIFIPSLSKAQCQGCSECSVKACWISRLICILKHRLKPVRNILHVYTLSQKPYFVPFYTCSVSFCMQKKCEPRVISFAKKKTYWKRQFFWNTLNMYILVWYGRIQKLRELQSFSQHDFWPTHGSDKKACISVIFPSPSLYLSLKRCPPAPQCKQMLFNGNNDSLAVAAWSTVLRKITDAMWCYTGLSAVID